MEFNVLNLMNSISKASVETNIEEYTEIILDYKDIVVTIHNKYSMDSIYELATGIQLVGELQQPLVLARIDGKYLLISGHRRISAIDVLVTEGHEKYRKVTCRYKDMTETQFRMELLTGNTFNRKMTDYDLMMEAREWKDVLTDAKKEGLIILENGERIRDYVAQILGESTGKIGQLEAINNNATEGIKEQLKSGNIGITTAHAASQLSEEKQKEIVSLSAAGQDLKSEEIIKLAEEEKARKAKENVSDSDTEQLEGQMGITDYKGVVPEQFDPTPEYMDSLCYDCKNWDKCTEKLATVTNCNEYEKRKGKENGVPVEGMGANNERIEIPQNNIAPKPIEPSSDLPVLKNNDQRKEWIDNFEKWAVWIEIEQTGERYYKYDFESGVSFVVKVSLYHPWENRGYSKQAKYGCEEYYILGTNEVGYYKGVDKTFSESKTNRSAMVDYLKDYQK